ncbi:hypothetical protein U9M48_036868 [Paspalum notatum var. saurae]|uniref:Uncharacterized protein n=1 Tax=Paspalum notatum var. saurae TaxID=547442 RepID=A0AAQ3UI37_PASNO
MHSPVCGEDSGCPRARSRYYLNLLDWGSSNVLSIGLGSTVYLWDASSGSTTELVTIDKGYAPHWRHIAICLNSSDVQLRDSILDRLLRTLRGVHESRLRLSNIISQAYAELNDEKQETWERV